MASFTDKNKREWILSLDVGMIIKVNEDVGIDFDLLMSKPDKFTDLLFANPRKLAEMLWVLCEDQAIAAGIDGKAFGKLLNRPTLDAATNAVLEALVLFYPRSSAGAVIAKKLPQMIAKMDAEMERVTTERMDKSISSIYSNSPESSG